jgi:hypothetical protein
MKLHKIKRVILSLEFDYFNISLIHAIEGEHTNIIEEI